MSIKTSDLETAGFWYNLRVTATGNNGGSSNGRTPGFGPGYWGSNPCPPARIGTHSSPFPIYFF